MPWRVFVGSMLTMLSLFIAFLFDYIILGQPFGRELQHTATLLAIALLVLGLVLAFTGLKRMESK